MEYLPMDLLLHCYSNKVGKICWRGHMLDDFLHGARLYFADLVIAMEFPDCHSVGQSGMCQPGIDSRTNRLT
jgi:hypothetical protein